jgi:hypothetical protein
MDSLGHIAGIRRFSLVYYITATQRLCVLIPTRDEEANHAISGFQTVQTFPTRAGPG